MVSDSLSLASSGSVMWGRIKIKSGTCFNNTRPWEGHFWGKLSYTNHAGQVCCDLNLLLNQNMQPLSRRHYTSLHLGLNGRILQGSD